MNVVVEKVGEKEGKERFILVNQKTGEAVTNKDVSEATLRKYLSGIGEPDELVENCFRKARKRFGKAAAGDDGEELDDIFSDIGLDDD